MREDARLLREAVLTFARASPGIDALVETGSRARGQPVDEFSDLDLELIGPGVHELVGREDWLVAFGDVLIALHLENGGPGEPEWPTCLVVFDGGRKIDFTLSGPGRLESLSSKGLDGTYGRGYVVHYDATGAAAALPAAQSTGPREHRPGPADFLDVQRDFWFEATQVPTYLGRGDLWHGLLRLEEMRASLLDMLQWQARATGGDSTDTWYLGHHIDDWTAPDIGAALPGCFSGYDAKSGWSALEACAGLFARAAGEVAECWDLPLLAAGDRVAGWLAAQVGPGPEWYARPAGPGTD